MRFSLECSAATERLVECARTRTQPDAALQGHLNACAACLDRWEAERRLTSGLRIMRIQAATGRSPEIVRSALLNEFAAKRRKPAGNRWLWSVAAAAVLLISTDVVRDLTTKPVAGPGTPAVEEQNDPQQEGFIAVPYAPPLAQGELMRVVHTELQTAELASLGVNVDPTWSTELPAD